MRNANFLATSRTPMLKKTISVKTKGKNEHYAIGKIIPPMLKNSISVKTKVKKNEHD